MQKGRFMSLGTIFIILGFLLLLEEAGIINGSLWNYLFPVILILLGLDLMYKKKQVNNLFNMFNVGTYGSCNKTDKKGRRVVDDQ